MGDIIGGLYRFLRLKNIYRMLEEFEIIKRFLEIFLLIFFIYFMRLWPGNLAAQKQD